MTVARRIAGFLMLLVPIAALPIIVGAPPLEVAAVFVGAACVAVWIIVAVRLIQP